VTSAVSALTSRNSRRAVFFRVPDRGFIGETEARLQFSAVRKFSVGDSHGMFVVGEDVNV
jgi:hypothetical protein